MDNKDFHDGSDTLVHVVKHSGICSEADLMCRLICLTVLERASTSILLLSSLTWYLRSSACG